MLEVVYIISRKVQLGRNYPSISIEKNGDLPSNCKWGFVLVLYKICVIVFEIRTPTWKGGTRFGRYKTSVKNSA